jgi:hypothetical protein
MTAATICLPANLNSTTQRAVSHTSKSYACPYLKDDHAAKIQISNWFQALNDQLTATSYKLHCGKESCTISADMEEHSKVQPISPKHSKIKKNTRKYRRIIIQNVAQ